MKYSTTILALAAAAIATPHPPVVTLSACPAVTETVTVTGTAPATEPTAVKPPVEYPPPTCENDDDVFDYDCTFDVKATPDQVTNAAGTAFAPGEPGATGRFRYGVNVARNMICYNIQLNGVTGGYQSAARTATHIHEGIAGKAGPPRIAFPNPEGDDNIRFSSGCLQGPFKTGILVNNQTGTDTGDGFTVDKLCSNPSGFFTDSHTMKFVPGAVRGQLA